MLSDRILRMERQGAKSLFAVAATLMTLGCTMNVPSDPGQPPDPGRVSPAEVLVRFQNYAESDAVDVEFFAANDSLVDLPADLFQEIHHVTASVGIAGTGIIQPQRSDAITFPCTSELVLGSAGGSFFDNETGEPRGAGAARWVREGPLALCGHAVTFEFRPNEEGFDTFVRVE